MSLSQIRVELLPQQPPSPRPSQLQQLVNRLPPYTRMNTDILMKFILVGDTGVGKSSFVYSLMNPPGSDSETMLPPKIPQYSTIGVDMITKYAMVYPDDLLVKTTIWDTAGQESFRSIISVYYRTVCGGFYVFDISQPDSLENLRDWIESSRKILHPSTHTSFMVLGTKIDVSRHRRKITKEQGIMFASEYGLPYTECSVFAHKNIELAYTRLIKHVLMKQKLSNHQIPGIRHLSLGLGVSSREGQTSLDERGREEREERRWYARTSLDERAREAREERENEIVPSCCLMV